jgi:hypothetical protein
MIAMDLPREGWPLVALVGRSNEPAAGGEVLSQPLLEVLY